MHLDGPRMYPSGPGSPGGPRRPAKRRPPGPPRPPGPGGPVTDISRHRLSKQDRGVWLVPQVIGHHTKRLRAQLRTCSFTCTRVLMMCIFWNEHIPEDVHTSLGLQPGLHLPESGPSWSPRVTRRAPWLVKSPGHPHFPFVGLTVPRFG